MLSHTGNVQLASVVTLIYVTGHVGLHLQHCQKILYNFMTALLILSCIPSCMGLNTIRE